MRKLIPVTLLAVILLLTLPATGAKKVDNGTNEFPAFEIWEQLVEQYNPEFNFDNR